MPGNRPRQGRPAISITLKALSDNLTGAEVTITGSKALLVKNPSSCRPVSITLPLMRRWPLLNVKDGRINYCRTPHAPREVDCRHTLTRSVRSTFHNATLFGSPVLRVCTQTAKRDRLRTLRNRSTGHGNRSRNLPFLHCVDCPFQFLQPVNVLLGDLSGRIGRSVQQHVRPRPTLSLYSSLRSSRLSGGEFGVQNQFFVNALPTSSGK